MNNSVKLFLIWTSGSDVILRHFFVPWSGTIGAILVEGIMRNNSVILF